jgi:hypothetical protein
VGAADPIVIRFRDDGNIDIEGYSLEHDNWMTRHNKGLTIALVNGPKEAKVNFDPFSFGPF